MRFAVLLTIASAILLVAFHEAAAQPSPGFEENFATDIGDFGGGANLSNPLAGGVDGDTDGYLRVSRDQINNLGTRASSGSLTGDYVGAGITHVRFSLNDVDDDQALEITFAIGTRTNLWLFNTPFLPPENSWTEFEVDLRDQANFIQIIGAGTFDEALAGVTRFHLRHDLAPYTQSPDQIMGEFGIDKISLVALTSVDPGTWGKIKTLFR